MLKRTNGNNDKLIRLLLAIQSLIDCLEDVAQEIEKQLPPSKRGGVFPGE